MAGVAGRSAWAALRVPSHVHHRLLKQNLLGPTPVQSRVLDALMPSPMKLPGAVDPARRAVIRWPTGSGKTLAFALPLIERIDIGWAGSGVQALVLSPTRELSLQTLHILQSLVSTKPNKKGNALRIVPILGTRRPKFDKELYRRPPDIAVGTPHTLGSLLAAGLLPLTPDPRKRTVVLDEVGELLKSHNWPHMENILSGADQTPNCIPSWQARPQDDRIARLRQRAAGGGPSDRGRWAEGNVWMVSAYMPTQAVKKVLMAADAQSDGSLEPGKTLKGPPVSVLAPPEHVPATIRHVAVMTDKPVGSVLASLFAWTTRNRMPRPPPLPFESRHHGRASSGGGAVGGGAKAPADDLLPAPTPLDQAAPPPAPAPALNSDQDQPGMAADGGLYGSVRAAVVFVRSGTDAEALVRTLRNRRVRAAAVHNHDGGDLIGNNVGARGHANRKFALLRLKEGRIRALVGTEMIALGVDVKGASHVVNVQVPKTASSYMHRAGRVGRVGGTPGTVVSLPRTKRELEQLRGFAQELGFELEEVAPPEPAPPPQPRQMERRQQVAAWRAQMDEYDEYYCDDDDDKEQDDDRGAGESRSVDASL